MFPGASFPDITCMGRRRSANRGLHRNELNSWCLYRELLAPALTSGTYQDLPSSFQNPRVLRTPSLLHFHLSWCASPGCEGQTSSLLLLLLSSWMSGSEYKGTLPPLRSSSPRHVSVLASCLGFTALPSHPPSFPNSYSACRSGSLHHHLPRVPHALLLMLVLESCVLFSLILFF